jgi:hypothetical protein
MLKPEPCIGKSAEQESPPPTVQVFLKREDLNHTGAHKINNAMGQVRPHPSGTIQPPRLRTGQALGHLRSYSHSPERSAAVSPVCASPPPPPLGGRGWRR